MRRVPVVPLVVVTITVLLVALVLSLTYLVEPLPSEPEKVVDGTTVIQGEVVWRGRTGTLERPVVVQDGGHLCLVDCDLRVPLEDMVFSDTDWFTVRDGGVLELEGSTVTIVAAGDPYLTYFFDTDEYDDDFLRRGPPHLYRVVNLRGATDPILHLELNGRGLDGTVHVAVQPSPGDPMEYLEALNVSSARGSAWVPFEVRLARYAGSVVLIAVFPQSPEMDGFMVRNMGVRDGDEQLPWDIDPSGYLHEDGWREVEVDKLVWEMENSPWGNLAFVEGDLELRRSTLSAPTLPREWWNWGYGAMKTFMENMDGPYNFLRTWRGGEVVLVDGRLVMEEARLEDVAVAAKGSSIDVRDSELWADREAVTLYRCVGSIEGTHLTCVYSVESDYEDYPYIDEPFLWAMSLWNCTGDGPFRISDCVIQDAVMGIDLAHSYVQVTGCTFLNCSYLAIWDHDSDGILSWEGLSTSNSFVDCNTSWYIRTHDCTLEFTGPNRPFREFEYFETWGDVVDVDEGELLHYELIWTYTSRADMYMPTLMVNGTGVVSRPTWVEVELHTEWGGDAWMRVDTSRTQQSIRFDGKDLFTDEGNGGSGLAPPRLSGPGWGTPSPGTVNMTIGISHSYWDSSMELPTSHDMELAVYMDGELEELVYMDWEPEPYSYRSLSVTVDLAFEPGLHDINITLDGFFMNATVPSVFDTLNASLGMVDAITPPYEVMEWMASEAHIVLQQGTDLVIEDVDEEDVPNGWLWASLTLPVDTTLTIRNMSLEPSLNNLYWSSLGIFAGGAGGIILEDINTTIIYLYIDGIWARLSNVTALTSEIYTSYNNLTFEDVTIDPYWWNFEGSVVDIHNSTIPCIYDSGIHGYATNLTIRDTELVGNSTELRISATNLTLEDVTARDLNVTVSIDYYDQTRITGCEFHGTPARLIVDDGYSDERISDFFGWNDIRGNTFWGPESGLVGEPWLLETLVQRNQLMDGARTWTWIQFEFSLDPEDPDLYFHDFHAEFMDIEDPRVVSIKYVYDPETFVYRVLLESDVPGGTVDPPLIHFVLYRDDVARHSPVWFFDVDPTTETETFIVPDWGDPSVEIVRILREGSGGTWWTGGP